MMRCGLRILRGIPFYDLEASRDGCSADSICCWPRVVGLSTAILALGLALVVMLAMFEYFALGDAIGHRAYRFWTASCALLLVYAQWLASTMPSDYPADWEMRYRYAWRFSAGRPRSRAHCFFSSSALLS